MTNPINPTWSAPPPIPQGPQLSEHVGDLVYIKVKEFLAQYPFPFGIKDGVRVDFEVLEGRTEVGERQADVTLSNVVLVKQLAQGVGREYFGRIAVGRGSNASPPIHLDPPRPGDERAIDAFLARQAGAAPQQPQQPAAPQGYAPTPTQAPAYAYGGPGAAPAPYGQPQQQPQQPTPYAPPQQPTPYGQPQQQPAPAYAPPQQPVPYGQPAAMPPASPPPRYDDPAPF